jgi:hypothetical protein
MDANDWNAEARDSANLIQRDCPDCDRGAFHTGAPGVCVAYGADDFARDDRARLEVTLQDAGLVELGFGVSDDGRVWCMAVQTNDDERLTDAVLDACRVAFGFNR